MDHVTWAAINVAIMQNCICESNIYRKVTTQPTHHILRIFFVVCFNISKVMGA